MSSENSITGPLTFQRRREGRDALIEEACRLRSIGMSFYAISQDLGIAAITAKKYVAAGNPDLLKKRVRRAGNPGKGCRLTDDQLRTLYGLHVKYETPIVELARRVYERVGYASVESAGAGIARGWKRLGFETLTAHGGSRRCQGVTRWGRNRGRGCSRVALVGSAYCLMHDPARREATVAHAARMREAA